MPTESLDQFVQELGLPAKAAKVVAKKGKYFLALGKTQKEIPTALAGEKDLAKMAGKEVVAVISGKNIVAVLFPKKPWKPQCVLCYIPVPDIYKRIDPELQKAVIEKFAAAGVLTRAQAETLSQMATPAR